MFSLVIPTYNNKKVIKPLLNKLTHDLNGLDYEIIVVDDDSPDNTAVEVLNYKALNPRVRLIIRKNGDGFSSAVIDGFKKAKGSIIGAMPPTIFSDTSVISNMINNVKGDYDLVIGCADGGFFKKFVTRLSSFLVKRLLGLHMTDPVSDFFVLNKKVFNKIRDDLNPEGSKVLLEICARASDLNFAECLFDGFSGSFSLNKYLKQLIYLRSSFD